MEKYLIIGLGNPNKEYRNTRHNIGLLILKKIIEESKIKKVFENKYGKIYKNTKNSVCYFLLPNTYMNIIGESIAYFLKKYKIGSGNILVLSDDIYINFGKIKIKKRGGSGGHNGLKSIEKVLNTKKYSRIKIGIGHDFNFGQQNKYVLGNFNKKDLKYIKEVIKNKIKNIIFTSYL